MCWAYRFKNDAVAAEGTEVAIPHSGRITRAGQEAALLTTKGGGLAWIVARYGISFPKSGGGRQLIWNARDDKLEKVETWARLIRQRFAVPVDAYVENAPGETWHVGSTAWMVGFYDEDSNGGAVTITEAGRGEERRPILIGRDDALAWLAAKPWSALEKLSEARRIEFCEAGLFEMKSLAIDARTSVPLRRAA